MPVGAHAHFSVSMDEHQLAPTNRYDSSPVSSGPHTPESDVAGPTCFNSQ